MNQRHIVVLVSHCCGKFETKYCWCCIGTSKLFEIFCVNFVGVSGSHCILRIYETRTEWVISAYFLKDLGFSNVLHSLNRIEILQYLSKSCWKYNRIGTDASFLGSIQTQNFIVVVLWFKFFQKISLMSRCGPISTKEIVLISRCWSKYCLKKIVLWLWYCSEPISLPPDLLLLQYSVYCVCSCNTIQLNTFFCCSDADLVCLLVRM